MNRIIALYMLFAAVWIVVSDMLVTAWGQASFEVILASIAKGLLFIAVTGLLLHRLLSRLMQQLEDLRQQERVHLQSANDQLEQRVAERTSELRTALAEVAKASQAKSRFMATMTHEIRTPLNAIIGLTQLLMKSSLTEEQRARLHKIRLSGWHLLATVNDVLDYAKIENGHISLERVSFDLSSLLVDVAPLIQDAATSKGLELKVDNLVTPMVVLGDPTRIKQAVLNLAGNAVKFTESGCVTLRLQVTEGVEGSVSARFEVRDTGIGIAPEQIPNLFQPFEQADQSIARRFGGSGLGLAITKEFVTLMQGEVGVSSVPGEGSLFWFCIPLTPDPSARHVLAPELLLRTRYSHCRLLVVDDSEINLDVTAGNLEEAGLQVDTASDGAEAVMRVPAGGYDLVIMDVHMPELDGLEATRRLRAAGHALPILAMTADDLQQERQHCLDAGFDDVIPKPVEPATLYASVLRWLDTPAVSSSRH